MVVEWSIRGGVEYTAPKNTDFQKCLFYKWDFNKMISSEKNTIDLIGMISDKDMIYIK